MDHNPMVADFKLKTAIRRRYKTELIEREVSKDGGKA